MRRTVALLLIALAPALWFVARAQEPTAAQPKLPTEQISIVTANGTTHPFTVELATTPKQQEVGEMFRTSVPADGGMLFVWPQARDVRMWMKNTLVPLDMLFIEADGTILSITDQAVPESLRIIDSGGPVVATLELAGGTAARLGITAGDKVVAPQFHTK